MVYNIFLYQLMSGERGNCWTSSYDRGRRTRKRDEMQHGVVILFMSAGKENLVTSNTLWGSLTESSPLASTCRLMQTKSHTMTGTDLCHHYFTFQAKVIFRR